MTTTGWKLDHADEVDPFSNIPGADDTYVAPPSPADAIRARMRRADFEDRCAREGRFFDPRDDEPTDFDR